MVWQRRWAAEPGYVAITPTGAGWVLDWSYARIYGFSPAGRLSWTLKVRFSGVDVATTSDATYVCNAQDQVFRYLTS
jgi:hypothetical protein